MFKNLQDFGKKIKELRIKKKLSLREACRLASYDPSNWSKMERGIISPPSDENILKKWAKILGINNNERELQKFIDEAKISQGIIPQDILSKSDKLKHLPAFFRTLRNKKPTKEEIDKLIELIRNS